jgi:transposase
MPLSERTYHCLVCGILDRDVNAAINILNRATAGMAGSNACGDGSKIPSAKQEAKGFSPW